MVALVVFGVPLAGTVGGKLLDINRPGTTQKEYYSIEVFGTAPGARLFYIPESHSVVMRGWLLGTLKDGSSYQVWARRDGRFFWVGTGQADDFVGFSFYGHAFMDGVDMVLLTIEPPGADLRQPSVEPIVTLIPPK
jgi:hypothetical protein